MQLSEGSIVRKVFAPRRCETVQASCRHIGANAHTAAGVAPSLDAARFSDQPHLVHLGHLLHEAHGHLGLLAVLPSLRRVGKLQQGLLS